MQSLPRPVRGIVPPLLTPLTNENELDVSGLHRLVDRLIAGNVQGLFALGTTGEGPSLSQSLRRQVVEIVCEHTSGRVPVLVSISDTSVTEATELADFCYSSGVAGLVATAPYYLPMGQQELLTHFDRLADLCPLPLMIYNIPSCTKTAFEAETVRKLADHENIVGLKDSSGDMAHFGAVVDLCQDVPDFTLLVGPEEILVESIAKGAHGGVHGGANLFPHLYTRLYEAAVAGDAPTTGELNSLVLRVGESIYSLDDHPSRIVKGLKGAAKMLGICNDFVAEPFRRFEGPQQQQLRVNLESLLPLVSPDESLSPLLASG